MTQQLHPQEIPLVFRTADGKLLPTKEQRAVRAELDEMAADWMVLDAEAHEEAYRVQLSRQMEALS